MTLKSVKAVMPAVFFVLLWGVLLIGIAGGDIYVRKDSQGVLHFTNVPSHSGYRVVIREWEAGSPVSSQARGRVEKIIRSTSERHGVDPHLVRAVIKVESDFDSRARSRKGAEGLMQLMPATAELHNVGDVYDPAENIEGGVRHLKVLLNRFEGNLRLTLAAYNAGISAVEKHDGVPPFAETKKYVQRVLKYYQGYRENGNHPTRKHVSR